MLRVSFIFVMFLLMANPFANFGAADAKKRKKKGGKKKKKEPEPEEETPEEEKYSNPGTIIGIDLGTTYSCVGVWKDDGVEIIPNDQGNRITPSWVAWNREERLIGEAAKNQGSENPANTVYEMKRFIGRRWKDKSVQHDKNMVPFKVVARDGRPYAEVQAAGKTLKISPEEVSAMILVRMKKTAEAFLGETITDAVITVPAYFNDAQRQATKDAGIISGLNVRRIINEPTAAAIAHGLDKANDNTKVLVFDLGGGTFDVSLLTLDEGVFEVMATSGNTHLGGEDFDHRISKHLAKLAEKKMGVTLGKRKRPMAKLKAASEKAKRALSTKMQVKVEIENFVEGRDFEVSLTRAKFEQLNADLFKKTLGPVKKVLKDAKVKKGEVDEIVLVGGSTRIPKVQELLKEFFNGKRLNTGLNPDEAVAYGAAVQGGILSGASGEKGKDLLLLDVIPLTIGIELVGKKYMRYVERNSVIPAKVTRMVTTEADYQTSVPIRVFQGERPKTTHNRLLGEFSLGGIPPAKAGVPEIEVTFAVDANGILHVTAKNLQTKKQEDLTITADKGRLSTDDIERMMREAEDNAEADKAWKETMDAKDELKNLIRQLQEFAKNGKDEIDEEQLQYLKDTLEDASEWVDNLDDEKRELVDYQAKKEELDDVFSELKDSMGGGESDDYDGPDLDDDDDYDYDAEGTHQEL